jgi:hypothetical protein
VLEAAGLLIALVAGAYVASAVLRVPMERVGFLVWGLIGLSLGVASVLPLVFGGRLPRTISVPLVVVTGLAVLTLGLVTRDATALLMGTLQGGLGLWLSRAGQPLQRVSTLAISIGCWVVAVPLIWYSRAQDWLFGNGPYPIVVTALVAYLVWAKLFRSELRLTPIRPLARVISTIAVVLLCAYGAAHTDPIFGASAYHNWSFYTGPALMIRQGATVLWDVPSQYGLLSVLAIAWVPFHNIWQAAYDLNTILNLLFALTLFALIRSPAGDLIDQAASGLLAFALLFCRVVDPRPYLAVQVFPSIGGMRFAWVLLLFLVTVRCAQRADAGRPTAWLLLAGSLVWVTGCLWSVESAFYCTVTWLPALALLSWSQGRRWLLLLAPPVAAAVLGGLLLVMAGRQIGHLPDVRGYFDFATSYAGGFGYVAPNPAGPVGVLIAAMGVALASLVVQRGPLRATSLAAAGMLWSTGSYFVGRSHPSNAINLMPMVVAAILALMRLQLPLPGPVAVRHLAAAVLAMLLAGSLAYEYGVVRFAATPPTPVSQIDSLRPRVSPALQALLSRSRIRRDEPLVYMGDEADGSPLMPVWQDSAGAPVLEPRLWLPAPGQLSVLPIGRRSEYLQRSQSRFPNGGWLIEADHPDLDVGWLDAWLDGHYQRGETLSGGGWHLTHYEARVPASLPLRRLASRVAQSDRVTVVA